MTMLVEAIYEEGVLRPLWPLDLAEGTKIAVLLVEPHRMKLEIMREAMNDPAVSRRFGGSGGGF